MTPARRLALVTAAAALLALGCRSPLDHGGGDRSWLCDTEHPPEWCEETPMRSRRNSYLCKNLKGVTPPAWCVGVEVSRHRDCHPIESQVVRAELDAVTPGGLGALYPGVTVSLQPGGEARSVPELGLIVVDCDLSGLGEEAEKLLAWRKGG